MKEKMIRKTVVSVMISIIGILCTQNVGMVYAEGRDGFTLKDTITPSYSNDFDVYNSGNRTIIAEYLGNKISLGAYSPGLFTVHKYNAFAISEAK